MATHPFAALSVGEPVWLADARAYVGLQEGVGASDNPTILAWAREMGGWIASWYTHDSIPWCGLFVAVMMKRSSIKLPVDPLAALHWASWGQPLTVGVPGAVLVFSRLGGGHVGFYVGEDDEAYHVLGGNQGDSVDIARVDKARCVGIRWPQELAKPSSGLRVLLAANGQPISTQEG